MPSASAHLSTSTPYPNLLNLRHQLPLAVALEPM